MQVASKTDKGLVRNENQDRVKTQQFDDGSVLVVVCDGMGGENAGSEASEIAVNEVFNRIVTSYRAGADNNSIRNLIISAISAANSVVYQKSLTVDSMVGMGTTCVCGIIRNDTIFISNVGDSRAYLISGNSMEQLTKDHSYVQLLYEQGEITKEEIKTHNKRNVITKAVGIDDNISPDYYEIEFPENSVLLLCTDGLSSYCNEDVICEIISKNNVLDACSMLIDKANDNGGKDNITVALVSY